MHRVLIAEDDRRVRSSLERALTLEGYEVVTTGDGASALQLHAERPADLLLLDVSMPNADGLSVCRRLRAQGDDTPVLMLTARHEVHDRVAGLDAGADEQHGVVDADAEIMFVANWSRVYRGLGLDPAPNHARTAFLPGPDANIQVAVPAAELPRQSGRPQHDLFKATATPAGEAALPAFVGVMPKIAGGDVCVVPFSAATLAAMKAAAVAVCPPAAAADGAFVSTDDVLTARTWRSLCSMAAPCCLRKSAKTLPASSMQQGLCAKRTPPPPTTPSDGQLLP